MVTGIALAWSELPLELIEGHGPAAPCRGGPAEASASAAAWQRGQEPRCSRSVW